MSFRRSILKALLVIGVVTASSGILVSNAAAGGADRGRSIGFSTPKSDELSTNLHQLTSKKDSLKQLEEDAYKTFQAFTPGGSLDAVAVNPIRPPATPAVPSKRLKEKLDRQKNLLWMTPDDLMAKTSVEEILKVKEYGPDGREKNDKPSMERFYDHMGDQTKTKPANSFNSLVSNDDEEATSLFGSKQPHDRALGSDMILPGDLKDSAQALKKLFDDDSDEKINGPKPVRPTFNNAFGLSDPTLLSREKELEHKKVMDEFRTILDPAWRPTAGADSLQPFDNALDTPRSKPILPSAVSGPGQPQRSLSEMLTGPVAPVAPVAVQAPADVNVQALGQYNSMPAIQKIELPKQGPTKPTFEFPKRPGL